MTVVTEEKLDSTLAHYGIKGMKWGVRRDRRTLDRLAGRKSSETTRKRTAAQDNQIKKAARRADVRNRRNMSDKTLKQKIERLKQEREFKKLTAEDLNPMRTAITNMLVGAGLDVSKKTVTAIMTLAVRKYGAGEDIKPSDLIPYLKPKK